MLSADVAVIYSFKDVMYIFALLLFLRFRPINY